MISNPTSSSLSMSPTKSSLSYWGLSRSLPDNNNMNNNNADQLKDDFLRSIESIRTDTCYDIFDETNEPWILITSTPPYFIIRSTHQFNKLFNTTSDHLIGQSFQTLMIGPKTKKNDLNTFIDNFHISPDRVVHTMLTLHRNVPLKLDDYSLYSIYGYPIYKKYLFNQTTNNNSSNQTNHLNPMSHFNHLSQKRQSNPIQIDPTDSLNESFSDTKPIAINNNNNNINISNNETKDNHLNEDFFDEINVSRTPVPENLRASMNKEATKDITKDISKEVSKDISKDNNKSMMSYFTSKRSNSKYNSEIAFIAILYSEYKDTSNQLRMQQSRLTLHKSASLTKYISGTFRQSQSNNRLSNLSNNTDEMNDTDSMNDIESKDSSSTSSSISNSDKQPPKKKKFMSNILKANNSRNNKTVKIDISNNEIKNPLNDRSYSESSQQSEQRSSDLDSITLSDA